MSNAYIQGGGGSSGGGGKVLQVVQGTTSTQDQNNSSTPADTGLSASITPSSADNDILCIVSHPSNYQEADGNSDLSQNIDLLRDSTAIYQAYCETTNTTGADYNVSFTFSYLDSPATTSAITYKTQHYLDGRGTNCVVQSGAHESTIILMEIDGS